MKYLAILAFFLLLPVFALDCVSTSYVNESKEQYMDVGFYPCMGESSHLSLKVRGVMPPTANITFSFYSENSTFLGDVNFTFSTMYMLPDYSNYFDISTHIWCGSGSSLPPVHMIVSVDNENVADVGTSMFKPCFLQARIVTLDLQGAIQVQRVWNEGKRICMSLKNAGIDYSPSELEDSQVLVNGKAYQFNKTAFSSMTKFISGAVSNPVCLCTVEEQGREDCVGANSGYDYDGSVINIQFFPFVGRGDSYLGFVSQTGGANETSVVPEEVPKQIEQPPLQEEPSPAPAPEKRSMTGLYFIISLLFILSIGILYISVSKKSDAPSPKKDFRKGTRK